MWGASQGLLDLHIVVLLRALVPYRQLTHEEGMFYAEQQASVFLKLVHVLEPPVPIEKIVTEVGLAKAIADDPGQPSPGQSVLDQASGEWVITLNLNDAADRTFVIAHEVKHILDHGFGSTLYRPVDMLSAEQRQEHAADYFATCLLMPRLWVERYWRRGVRSAEKMASLFGMTAARAQLRMEALGLLEPDDDGTITP